MTVYVYALCEPSTGEIRYVGKSRNPVQRLAGHLTSTGRVGSWIATLESVPVVRVLEACETEEDALANERRFIANFNIGGRLLNIAHTRTNPEAVERTSFSGFGERFTLRRRELGLSNADISRATGIKQCTLSNLEHGRLGRSGFMMCDDAVRLARALNTTVEYLVTGDPS
jgi:predicted GIY-YIG superfamily endonuclease